MPSLSPRLDVQPLPDPRREPRIGHDRLAERGVGRRQDDRENEDLRRAEEPNSAGAERPARQDRQRQPDPEQPSRDARTRAAAPTGRCARRRRRARASASARRGPEPARCVGPRSIQPSPLLPKSRPAERKKIGAETGVRSSARETAGVRDQDSGDRRECPRAHATRIPYDVRSRRLDARADGRPRTPRQHQRRSRHRRCTAGSYVDGAPLSSRRQPSRISCTACAPTIAVPGIARSARTVFRRRSKFLARRRES